MAVDARPDRPNFVLFDVQRDQLPDPNARPVEQLDHRPVAERHPPRPPIAVAACLVPGLNLLILPSLVTAGTLLVLRAPPEADRWGRGAPDPD